MVTEIPKLPKQKGLVPKGGSANNVLPFFVRWRGVFAHPYCNTDFGLCPDRSWTSSKPRPTGCWRTEATPHPPLPRSPFSHRRRLILVALDRANNVRPYYSSCGAGYHRGAISSTAGGYHPAARFSLADRISLRGRLSPRPGEASKKSTSGRGRNPSLYCSTGARKLPFAARNKE